LAVIEVTSGISKLAKPSQFAAAEAVGIATTAPNRTAEHDRTLNPLIMTSLPFLIRFTRYCVELLPAWLQSKISRRRYRAALTAQKAVRVALCAIENEKMSRRQARIAQYVPQNRNTGFDCGSAAKSGSIKTGVSQRPGSPLLRAS
jgi:hypothetical protein